MRKNDKIALFIAIVVISLLLYYFLIPNRNWLGKSYLETTESEAFAVVELFTSEGCSSCPPADALMERIQKEAKDKNVYFLAFHVDYWDHLNWRDRFSSVEYTSRQQQYANWMNRSIIYTPQFIINGTSEFGGDNARMLYSLVSDALQKKPAAAMTLRAFSNDNTILIDYQINEISENTSLLVALVQKEATTKVKRGENGGRLLHHIQIVRQANSILLNEKEGSMAIAKPENFNTKDWELIGIMQNNATGIISAATKAQFN